MKKSKQLKEMTKEELRKEVTKSKNLTYIIFFFIFAYLIISLIQVLIQGCYFSHIEIIEIISMSALMLSCLSVSIPTKLAAETELRIREVMEELKK